MIDETPQFTTGSATSQTSQEKPQTPQESTVVAYCQQCGRGLSAVSQRRVGAGIFCEPCATLRGAQPDGWTPVNAGTVPPPNFSQAQNARSPLPSEPNPVLAGFLGLVPGVGAMFNGQYAKGVIHLVIFVVLVSLADNVNWVLWWFVWGWVFYQAFEAYHTAVARRDGQSLPDPFGWNELGERLGFARNWAPATPAPASRPSTAAASAAAFTRSAAGTTPAAAMPMDTHSDPYNAPLPDVPNVPPAPDASAASPTNPGSVPYSPTYTGVNSSVAGSSPLLIGSRRFPVGAAWLIGLGLLFLLGNLLPAWHLDGRWLVPILLAGIALWMGGSRLVSYQETRAVLGSLPAQTTNVVGLVLGPVLLLTIAILLALQDASLVPLRHSWPVLLIVWGGLLLLERAGNAASRTP